MRIALCVEYNGSNYFGWQKQKIHKEKTIQYHVDKAISKVADEKINTICAGRTDTGVHALNQIIHFDTTKKRLDYNVIAFNDINPQSPIHILIIPKIHIPTLNDLNEENKILMGELVFTAKLLAEDLGIQEPGYRLNFKKNRLKG